MKNNLIVIDTTKNTFTLDGKPIEKADEIKIKVTPLATEVTLTIKECDLIFISELGKKQTDKATELQSQSEISKTEWKNKVNDYIKNNKINIPDKMVLDTIQQKSCQ